jgi:Acetyltransferases, including N-acetylases of ribosomal proteins
MHSAPKEIRTERLVLRRWRKPEDWEAFAAQGADALVMRYFQSTRTREQAHEQADFFSRSMNEGLGPWVLTLKENDSFIGTAGFWAAHDYLPMAPGVELGWRLNAGYWGQGLAVEAARAAADDLFTRTDAPEFFAITTVTNEPSRRALLKLGMRYCPEEEFDHPKVPEGSPLRRHVVYRYSRDSWLAGGK